MLVGPAWRDLAAPAALFARLAATAAPHTRVLVVSDAASGSRAERLMRNAGWHEVTHLPLPDGLLLVGCLGNDGPPVAASHYGVPFTEGDPNDSRAVVAELLRGAASVLELGCSDGLTTRVLAGRGQRVVAVEIDPEAADRARPFAEQVLVADLDMADAFDALGDRTFSAVAVADVLEHLRDPASALRRAVRHLATNGDVVLSVPNMAHADVRLALLDGHVPYADLGLLDRTHVHWFTREGLLRLLADCGLCAVEWRNVLRAPGTTEVPLDESLRHAASQWFADDPNAATYQWVVRCRRAGEGTPAPLDEPAEPNRVFLHSPAQGIRASSRSLAAALRRRLRR
jgi:2-polyprenyl-3-methyl-5-hydroxy-6-metoxy-1,4-benzoquinol methylase